MRPLYLPRLKTACLKGRGFRPYLQTINIGSLLGLPLIIGQRKLGVIILEFGKPRNFNQDEIIRAENATRHISLTLEKGLSLENAEQSVQELTGLYEISKTFNTQHPTENIYGSLVKRMAKLVGSQMCVLCLHDSSNDEIHAQVSGFGVKDKLLDKFHFPAQAMLEAADFTAHNSVILSKDRENIPPEIQQIIRRFKIKTAIVAAMHAEDELLGFVFAANKPLGFSKDDARMMGVFARQAATVINSARSFKKEQKQTERLSALFKLSTDLAEVLKSEEAFQRIAQGLHDILEYDHIGIFSIEETTGDRLLRASIGWPDVPENWRIPVGQGVTEDPIHDAQSHYIPDVNQDPRYLSGVGGSEVDCPIWIDDKIGAILVVESKQTYAFDQEDFDLLTVAANLAGLALTRSHMFETSQRQADLQAALFQLSTELATHLNKKDICRYVVYGLQKMLGFGHVGVFLVDEETGDRVLIAGTTLENEDIEVRIPPGQGLSERPLVDGKLYYSPDVKSEPNYVHDARGGKVLRGAEVDVPIQINDKVSGVLVAESEQAQAFNQRDFDALSAVADLTGLALTRSQLYENTQRQTKLQATLFQLNTELAPYLKEDDICQQVVTSLHENLGYDHTSIYLVEQHSGARNRIASSGCLDEPLQDRLLPGQGLSERPFLDGQLHYSSDVSKEPNYIPGASGSEVDVPIQVGDDKVGVLIIESVHPHAFDQIDFDVLIAVANLTGLALTRSKLFSAERKQFDELAFLHAIALAITEATSEDQLIERATHIIAEKLYLDNFAFLLVDESIGALRLHPSCHIYHNLFSEDMTVSFGEGIVGHVVKTGLPERVADVASSPHYLQVDPKTRSELVVPLKLGGSVIGVINAESKKLDAFSEADERLLIIMAGQISTTIARLRAADIERRNAEELAVLYELSQQLILQLDIGHVLEETNKGVTRLLNTSEFYIALVNHETKQVAFPINISASEDDLSNIIIGLDEGLTGHIIQTKAPVLIKENPEAWQKKNKIKIEGELPQSWLGVPLLIGKNAIGVMAIQDYELSNVYDEHDLEIMTAIASQAAVAIENARLFEETELHAKELSVLNELAQTLTQQLDIDHILKETYKGIKHLIDTADFYIGLLDSEKTKITFPIIKSSSEEDLKYEEIAPDEGLTGHIIKTKKTIMINDNFKLWEKENAVESVGEMPQSWLGVPLLIGKDAIGVMAIQDFTKQDVYDAHDLEIMTAIASQAAIAIENARLFDKVKRLASTDELTGLNNRRHFLELAHAEFNRGLRYGGSLSTLLLDIDNFKDFNDTYGHAIGDKVLQVVAKLCMGSLRITDILGRYGGEEFAILLPETHLEVSKTVAERLRKSVAETLIPTERGDLSVTVSIGIAEKNELTPTLETLIARADQAMYVAKHKGRNQVATSV